MRATYASNVTHYELMLEVLAKHFDDVLFAGPFEIDHDRLQSVGRFLPSQVRALLEKRTVDRSNLGANRLPQSFWNVAPVARRFAPQALRSVLSPHQVTRGQAKHIARHFKRSEYFQFVEGLGHLVLRNNKDLVSAMERRNLHHEVFEEEIELFANAPHTPSPDPIRDILNEEYDSATRIILYSEVARQSFLARGFAADKLRVVPLVTAPAPRLTAVCKRNELEIGFVGRLDVYKGIDLAVAAVKEFHPKARLSVAGPGSPKMISWLRSHEHVDYLGVLNRSQLSALYARVRTLIAPSIESFGLAVVDAVSSATPVLASPTVGAVDYIASPNLKIVNHRLPSVWADAIAGVEPHSRSNQAPGPVLTYDAESIATDYGLILRELIGSQSQ